MKKIVSLIIVAIMACGLSSNIQAQVFKKHAYETTVKVKNKVGQWSEWSGFKPCGVNIVIDIPHMFVTVGKKKVDIIAVGDCEKDENGNSWSTFYCVDSNNVPYTVKLVNQSDGQKLFYLNCENKKVGYMVR